MYRGFKLAYTYSNEHYYSIGKKIHENTKVLVRRVLDNLTLNSEINGTLLEQEWFPQLKFDIFISHSHRNELYALTLAGWLSETFGLKAFIDSYVWGFSDELLKNIDNKYCKNKDKNNSYSYEQRNISTSHIHMMLNSALLKMIDRTECFIIIETNESITTHEIFGEKRTYSPWIYSELLISNLIRKRSKESHRSHVIIKRGQKKSNLLEHFRVSYMVDFDHLIPITFIDLDKWKDSYESDQNALDLLYKLYPAKEIINQFEEI
ncbi:MAG: hypothetical protein WC155_02115 [Candidatus Cloacimonadales bacterium]